MSWLEQLPVGYWQVQGAALLFLALLLTIGRSVFRFSKNEIGSKSCRALILGGLCGAATVVGGAIAFFHFAETHRQLVALLAKIAWLNWTIETVFSLAPLIGALCGVLCAAAVRHLRQIQRPSI